MAETNPKAFRITLDLLPQSKENLDRLQTLINCNTRAETFRQALNIMDFVANELASGNKFIIIDSEGKEREIVFPILVNRGNGQNGS